MMTTTTCWFCGVLCPIQGSAELPEGGAEPAGTCPACEAEQALEALL